MAGIYHSGYILPVRHLDYGRLMASRSLNIKSAIFTPVIGLLFFGAAPFFGAAVLVSCSQPDKDSVAGDKPLPPSEAEPQINKEIAGKQAEAVNGAPEIKGALLASGKTVSSRTDYRGKFLIVNFWATWCTPCVAELPALERLYQELKIRFPAGGFELVSINADIDSSLAAVKEMVRSRGLTFPVVLDPEGVNVKAFNLSGFPETFFIDQAGQFVRTRDPDSEPLSGPPRSAPEVDRLISDRPWDSQQYIDLVAGLIDRPK